MTAKQRLRVVEYSEKAGVSVACERFGINSRQTLYTWIKRYQEHGMKGLEDQSSRPKSPHRKVTPDLEKLILAFIEEGGGYPSLSELRDHVRIDLDTKISVETVRQILIRNGIPTATEERINDPMRLFFREQMKEERREQRVGGGLAQEYSKPFDVWDGSPIRPK